jgi:hypothetical protein
VRRLRETDEGTGDWRKLHKDQLNGLCSSSNVILMIKSIRMGWTVHVVRRGEIKCIHGFGVEV